MAWDQAQNNSFAIVCETSIILILMPTNNENSLETDVATHQF